MTSPNDKKAPDAGRGCAITSQSGLTLIYVIVGMVVISILGLGIHNMTSRTAVNQARRLSHDQVIYLARSGMNYAAAWHKHYMDTESSAEAAADAFQDCDGDSDTFEPAGQFTLAVGEPAEDNGDWIVPVRAMGAVSDSTYTLYKEFVFTGSSSGGGDGNYALASPNADLTTADGSQIQGSVAGQNVTLGEGTQVQADGAGNGGNVVAEGNVSLEDDSTVEGSICTGGNVTLAEGASVDGDIRAGGNVTLNLETEVGGSIYSEGNVVLWGALVYGDIHAFGNVNISDSEVYGSIFAEGNVGILSSSYVHGDIHTAGSYDHGSSSEAGGSIYYEGDEGFIDPEAPGECPDMSSPPHYAFTAGGDDISVSRHDDWVIDSGSYGALETDHHASITLSAGTYYTDSYFFESMDISRHHDLRLDLSEEGSITVFVTGDVSFDHHLDILVSTDGINYAPMADVDPSLASRVYFETMGSFSLYQQSQWFGTIFAEDDISFGSGNLLIGSYLTASGQIVNDNALDVTHVPSDYAAENW